MRWLDEHSAEVRSGLLAALFLAVLVAAALLLREVRAVTWLRTRMDYVRLGIFAEHARGTAAATQYLHAIERLFELRERPRVEQDNFREYLRALAPFDARVRPEVAGFVDIYERCRYGPNDATDTQLRAIRSLYREAFRRL